MKSNDETSKDVLQERSLRECWQFDYNSNVSSCESQTRDSFMWLNMGINYGKTAGTVMQKGEFTSPWSEASPVWTLCVGNCTCATPDTSTDIPRTKSGWKAKFGSPKSQSK